jgi:hypothetical protein
MFGPPDNRISPTDRADVYALLGFGGPECGQSIPAFLDLSVVVSGARLTELHARAQEEFRRGSGRGGLRGLTEFRVGVELTPERSALRLTDVKQGRSNHGGRELDRTRTIVGTIHTHPWDVAQSIADVRNLLRTNDIGGGVVTYTGRISLLVKDPNRSDVDRSPFAMEVALQGASLRRATDLVERIGLFGTLSAAFDLPIRAARDPYIEVVCSGLGLLHYAGEVGDLVLRRR